MFIVLIVFSAYGEGFCVVPVRMAAHDSACLEMRDKKKKKTKKQLKGSESQLGMREVRQEGDKCSCETKDEFLHEWTITL